MESSEYFVYCGLFIRKSSGKRSAKIAKGEFLEVPNELVADLLPALEGSSQLFADVDLSLLGLQHGGGQVGSDGAVGAQTGGHSLPGGESTAGSQCVNLDTLLSTHNIQRSDGSGAGRNIGNVTGAAEHTTQRVVGDHFGHGLDKTGTHSQELFQGVCGEGLGVDSANTAGPAEGSVSHICAAQGSQLIGVGLDVLIGPEVDLLQGHTQLGIQTVVEVAHKVAASAVGAVPGCDLALFIGILIQEEHMNIPAADTVLIQHLGQGDKHRIFRTGKNQHQLGIVNVRKADALKKVINEKAFTENGGLKNENSCYIR